VVYFITETLKNAHGQYTDQTIKRCGRIVGTIAKSLDAAFHDSVCHTEEEQTYRAKHDYDRDIRSFVSEYRDQKLFTYIPGRKHVSFPDIISSGEIRDKAKLKARLINYNFKLALLQQEES
jgi:hypothetical protein